MRIRTAVLTGITGLMLGTGFASIASAQPRVRIHRYRNRSPYMAGRFRAGGEWRAEQMVRQAYLDILGREPDPAGLREYTDAMVNRGWTDAAVRRSLMSSPEYAQRYGRYGLNSQRYNTYRYAQPYYSQRYSPPRYNPQPHYIRRFNTQRYSAPTLPPSRLVRRDEVRSQQARPEHDRGEHEGREQDRGGRGNHDHGDHGDRGHGDHGHHER